MLTATEIQKILETNLLNCRAIVEGEDGVHFTAQIICEQFSGLNSLKRQQMVYGFLNTYIQQGDIHALSMKTWTPSEWEKQHG
ncbi:MAG: BolA/IbaG family iron-sulfur metabolism protein [Proteobacteria bacterium]|nr:BolA/IbaG family iron-sulfur metabolism protein [Pseudomonadota bacterium]